MEHLIYQNVFAGVPWTEEEHRTFLIGLQKLGKGDWRGISRNFVKTRTPTQVASHAQKYFLRRNNLNKRRRRSSLFDMSPNTVCINILGENMNIPLMCWIFTRIPKFLKIARRPCLSVKFTITEGYSGKYPTCYQVFFSVLP